MTPDTDRSAKRMQWVDRETLLYDRIPRILASTALLTLMMFAAVGWLLHYDFHGITWFLVGMVVATFYSKIAGRLHTW